MALAKTLISEANFLLLDEPTNHLDMQSVNILIQALEQYEGTFIVISHDRFFVENVATKIWYIEDYQLKEYPGTYAEYEQWQEDREKAAKKAGLPSPSANKPLPKEEPKADAHARQNAVARPEKGPQGAGRSRRRKSTSWKRSWPTTKSSSPTPKSTTTPPSSRTPR